MSEAVLLGYAELLNKLLAQLGKYMIESALVFPLTSGQYSLKLTTTPSRPTLHRGSQRATRRQNRMLEAFMTTQKWPSLVRVQAQPSKSLDR